MLLEGLDVRPGDVCLSIASAGDNTLALLSRDPGRVIAVDLSQAQLACLELRVAAYRELSHPELLELIGSTPSRRRDAHYRRCRPLLAPLESTLRRLAGTKPDITLAELQAELQRRRGVVAGLSTIHNALSRLGLWNLFLGTKPGSPSRRARWSRHSRGRGGGSACLMRVSTPRSTRSAMPRTSRRAT